MQSWDDCADAPHHNMADSQVFKRLRKSKRKHSPAVRLEVIERVKKGERNVDIARTMNMSESTVRTIRDRAKALFMPVADSQKKILCVNNSVERMETKLSTWVRACNEAGVSLSKGQVTSKARRLYKLLTKNNPEAATFNATEDWLYRFKKIHNIWIKVNCISPDANESWEDIREPGEMLLDEYGEELEYKPTYVVEHVDHETNEITETPAQSQQEHINPIYVTNPSTDTQDETMRQFGKYVCSLLKAFPPEQNIQMQRKIINLIIQEYPE